MELDGKLQLRTYTFFFFNEIEITKREKEKKKPQAKSETDKNKSFSQMLLCITFFGDHRIFLLSVTHPCLFYSETLTFGKKKAIKW